MRSLLAEVMDRRLAALGPATRFEQSMLTLPPNMMNGHMPTLASLSLPSRLSRQYAAGAPCRIGHQLSTSAPSSSARDLGPRGSVSARSHSSGITRKKAHSRAYNSSTGAPPSDAPSRWVIRRQIAGNHRKPDRFAHSSRGWDSCRYRVSEMFAHRVPWWIKRTNAFARFATTTFPELSKPRPADISTAGLSTSCTHQAVIGTNSAENVRCQY